MENETIPHQDLTYQINGLAMTVHRQMPRGLKEEFYQKALQEEMIKHGLMSVMEYEVQVYYQNTCLGRMYLDHFVNGCVVVEDKAFSHKTDDKNVSQVISYMAATGAQVGLLLNFGNSRLEYRRILRPKLMQNDWKKNILNHVWIPPHLRDVERDWDEIAPQLQFVHKGKVLTDVADKTDKLEMTQVHVKRQN